MTRLWNNFHQVHTKSKENHCEQENGRAYTGNQNRPW